MGAGRDIWFAWDHLGFSIKIPTSQETLQAQVTGTAGGLTVLFLTFQPVLCLQPHLNL